MRKSFYQPRLSFNLWFYYAPVLQSPLESNVVAQQTTCRECVLLGNFHINGLVQDCRDSIVLAMELLQYCTKPLIWSSYMIITFRANGTDGTKPLPEPILTYHQRCSVALTAISLEVLITLICNMGSEITPSKLLPHLRSKWVNRLHLPGANELTHWGRDKMATISQTTVSNAFSWMKMYQFRLRFH